MDTTWTHAYDSTPEDLGERATPRVAAAYNRVQRQKLAEAFAGGDPGKEAVTEYRNDRDRWIGWLGLALAEEDM